MKLKFSCLISNGKCILIFFIVNRRIAGDYSTFKLASPRVINSLLHNIGTTKLFRNDFSILATVAL